MKKNKAKRGQKSELEKTDQEKDQGNYWRQAGVLIHTGHRPAIALKIFYSSLPVRAVTVLPATVGSVAILAIAAGALGASIIFGAKHFGGYNPSFPVIAVIVLIIAHAATPVIVVCRIIAPAAIFAK